MGPDDSHFQLIAWLCIWFHGLFKDWGPHQILIRFSCIVHPASSRLVYAVAEVIFSSSISTFSRISHLCIRLAYSTWPHLITHQIYPASDKCFKLKWWQVFFGSAKLTETLSENWNVQVTISNVKTYNNKRLAISCTVSGHCHFTLESNVSRAVEE